LATINNDKRKWQSGEGIKMINMKIMMAVISLCLIILCTMCQAEEAAYYDWKGLKSYASKNYTESIVHFDRSIKQDPTYIDARLHKGDVQREIKDYNASLKSYEGALQVNSEKAAAHPRAASCGVLRFKIKQKQPGPG
jgi:tetratricopeptide (TPR) repeat protein